MKDEAVSRLRSGGVRPGTPDPPGATCRSGGVNFSVFSPHASRMVLILYRNCTDTDPVRVITLEGPEHETSSFWHVFVEGAGPGLYYNWRVPDALWPTHLLLDPWARAISDNLWNRRRALAEPEVAIALRGRVEADDRYDWEGDQPVDHAPERTILYELHVGSFTQHPSSSVIGNGTYRALIEKIPYLEALGITDVELMPVMAFDAQDVPRSTEALGLSNHWGYSPCAFFAAHPGYASGHDARREFRDMVKAFHKAGIGVILDVVFNHTAEGDHEGPTIHFKALARDVFYHLDPDDPSRYRNYTGCGNTLNANHPVVCDFIVRCLEYWLDEMHVDGFRFDLASALTRGQNGDPLEHAPVLRAIEASPILANARLIAEPWDAQQLYQLGHFGSARWLEWNGQYRDTIRRAVRGERGTIRELATRISGSSDVYERDGKTPLNSVNYVTCHDGFTLWDMVSYDRKHNEANGEDNADGSDSNFSWNCGWEGPTPDPEILGLRRRQARNSIAILLLSQGIPMLSAGDEFHRTQQGNNNAWCQDNELSWIDWEMAERNSDMVRFVREMIGFRKRHASLSRVRFLTGEPGSGRNGQHDVVWYGDGLGEPNWEDPDSRILRWTLAGQTPGESDLHVILNLSDHSRSFEVPPPVGGRWHVAVNTALEPPSDITAVEHQTPVLDAVLRTDARSVVVLELR